MRQLITIWVLASLAVLLLAPSQGSAAPLPQRHPYQKTLRGYLATLSDADFTVELQPVTYVEEYFKDLDTVGRYWMFFLTPKSPDIPSNQGIRVAPKHFTLESIEAGDAVNLASGRNQFMDPKDVAWWTQWDYPGNPYRGSAPLKRRAFVTAAVDMMMQDEEHEAGKNLRSDYLGGSMIRFAYCYRVARDVAPQPIQEAYAVGLIRMFEKLERSTPRGSGGSDMEFFQLPAMWYAADALGGDFKQRALKRARVVIDTITSKTGYEKHGGAFDVAYQGIALRFLTWGAMLYQDPKVNEAVHKMLVLKAHLSLPEPKDGMYGPTHFSTGTAPDAPHDAWAWVSRDLAMSMIDDMALYTVWARVGVPNESDLRAQVKTGMEHLGGLEPSNAAPGAWKEVHWVNTLNFAFDCYPSGFYQRLTDLAKANSPLTKPVYARDENFIRDLNGGGEFLAAKFDGYAVVIHTGAIAHKWATGVSGKSGGGISAFWTPEGGTAILGRGRGTQSSTPDEWTDDHQRGPYTWAVHAITGRGAKGHYFSTARILDIKSKYDIDGTKSAVVTISGDLAGSTWADPEDELKGSVQYQRELHLDKDGINVMSGLTIDGHDQIPELWEMIPLFDGPKAAEPQVDFRVAGEWAPATETAAEADQVRLTRYGKPVYLVMEKPQRMKITSASEPSAHGGVAMRNIMIDLTGAQGRLGVRYRITTRP